MNEFNKKIIVATKWSATTEIMAKLIAPITSLLLARLLTPEAFGVVATVAMIVSFVDIFSDAGFQRYLVQHEFKDDNEKNNSATVAFWTNLLISFLLWFFIIAFCEKIAIAVGNPGLGNVITIACASLPLTSFSSIQMALCRRDFDYKKLFFARIIVISIPFIITLPLALIFHNFWAIIAGNILMNLSNAIVLTINSKWKPNYFYSVVILKEMFSFSIWSLLEAISVWLTSYIGVFIVGITLNLYYLGIYKTSMTTVDQIMSIITGATTTVLLSALSRLQNNPAEYERILFKFQRLVAILILPMGVGMFIYKHLITRLLLGSQWEQAAGFIGLWGLMSAISIVFCNYCSIVYISKGKPKLSLLAQVLHLLVLVPLLNISVNYGFETLYIVRSLVRFQFIAVHFILLYFFINISPWKMLINVFPSMFCSAIMGLVAYFLQRISNDVIFNIISIFACIIIYFLLLLLFTNTRRELLWVLGKFLPFKNLNKFSLEDTKLEI